MQVQRSFTQNLSFGRLPHCSHLPVQEVMPGPPSVRHFAASAVQGASNAAASLPHAAAQSQLPSSAGGYGHSFPKEAFDSGQRGSSLAENSYRC